ncbi:hypothetical protein D3C72_1480590 [compost metagenome]
MTAGLASARFTSWFRRCTMASLVLAGASRPCQELDSSAAPCSERVGTSGANCDRCKVAIPNATSLPLAIRPRNSGQLPNMTVTCPPIRSAMAGPWPL